MSFRSETGLNRFNDQFKTHQEQAKEQPKTCELSASFRVSRLIPATPSGGPPQELETSQDFGCGNERASQHGYRSEATSLFAR